MYDNFYVTRNGDFYKNINNEIVKLTIPKDLYFIFAKLVILTFIGPIDGNIIYKDHDPSNISLSNINVEPYVIDKGNNILY